MSRPGLQPAQAGRKDVLYDLGCGDGRRAEPAARIVAHPFKLGDWEADESSPVISSNLYFDHQELLSVEELEEEA